MRVAERLLSGQADSPTVQNLVPFHAVRFQFRVAPVVRVATDSSVDLPEIPMAPVLVGYLAKRTARADVPMAGGQPSWNTWRREISKKPEENLQDPEEPTKPEAAGAPTLRAGEEILEVCSVSECISSGPDGWEDQWEHNAMFFFDTPALAWKFVPDAERTEFDLYAYRLFPVVFKAGQRLPFEPPPLNVAAFPKDFERLGLDVVSRGTAERWEHSPLSCNAMSDLVAVNRYCLLDDLGVALQCAMAFEAGQGEPGPYFVVEVWRERRAKVAGS